MRLSCASSPSSDRQTRVALLLNTTCQRTALLEHLAGGEAWGSLRFLPAVESADGIITYTARIRAAHRPGRLAASL